MSSPDQLHSIPITPALSPVLSDRYVARWSHVLMTAVFATLFLFLSYLPLSTSITWLNVAEGRAIIDAGAASATPAQFALAEGMSHQSTGWLSRVVMASCESWGGAAALGSLQTAVTFSTFLLWAVCLHRITGRKSLVLIGVALSFYMAWPGLAVLRPGMFGSLIATLLLLALSRAPVWNHVKSVSSERSSGRLPLWSLPLTIALWANLDGSFLIGVAVIAAYLVGEVIDHLRSHSWRTLLANSQVRYWLITTELCCVATLLQPEVWSVWADILRGDFGLLGPASDLRQPLVLLSWSGAGFAGLWFTALFLFRLSRCRVRSVEVLLWCGGSAVLVCGVHLSTVVVPILIMALLRHATDVHRQWFDKFPAMAIRHRDQENPQAMKFSLSLVCLLLGWVAFALSPLSQPVLGGTERSEQQIYARGTPLELTSLLLKQRDPAMTWAPAPWADWLAWTLGPEAKFFASSQLGRFPAQVRRDYITVFNGNLGWDKVLDRYGVETLVVDKQSQSQLIRQAQSRDSAWKAVYEDQQGFVFRRRVADRFSLSKSQEGATTSW